MVVSEILRSGFVDALAMSAPQRMKIFPDVMLHQSRRLHALDFLAMRCCHVGDSWVAVIDPHASGWIFPTAYIIYIYV